MKRIPKILSIVLFVLLALLVGGLIAIQSPRCQTYLARKVLGSLQSKIDADITIDKIHIRPFDYVLVKDVLVLDRHPYYNPQSEANPQDTIAKAKYIKAQFSLKGLLKHDGIYLRDVSIEDGVFNFVSEPKHLSNLTRVMGKEPVEDSLFVPAPPKEDSGKQILTAANVSLQNFSFRFINMANPKESFPDAINWSDLEIDRIFLKGRDLSMKGNVVSGVVDHMEFRENSGYQVKELSGKARVGNGLTDIQDMHLVDNFSDISFPSLKFTYKDMASWSNFCEEVSMDARLSPSKVDLKSVSYFAHGLQGKSMEGVLDAAVEGPVASFHFPYVSFKSSDGNFALDASGDLTGLPSTQDMVLDFDISRLFFSMGGLETFLHGWAPASRLSLAHLAKGDTFDLSGKAQGPINDLDVDASLMSELTSGGLYTGLKINNILDKDKPISMSGNVSTRKLDLGDILGVKSLGTATLTSGVELSLGTPLSVRLDSVYVHNLEFNDYLYEEIRASGLYDGGVIAARVVSHDPNLGFLLQAESGPSEETGNTYYRISGKIAYADLAKLHFYNGPGGHDKWEGTARVHDTQIGADFRTRPSPEGNPNGKLLERSNLIGYIGISGLKLEDDAGKHDIGEIHISSRMGPRSSRLRVESSFMEASYVGTGDPGTFISDLKSITVDSHLQALNHAGVSTTAFSGNNYDVSLTLLQSQDLLGFFVPGLYVSPGTTLTTKVDNEGKMTARVRSNILAIGKNNIRGLNIDARSDNDLSVIVSSDSLNASILSLKNLSVNLASEDNDPTLSLSFNNDEDNNGNISLTSLIERNPSDSLSFLAKLDPSTIVFQGGKWDLRSEPIFSDESRIFTIEGLALASGDQFLGMDGGLSGSATDTLNVGVRNLNIGILNNFLTLPLDIQGKVTADAKVLSPVTKGKLGLILGMKCDSTSVAGAPLGTLDISSTWDEEKNGFSVKVDNSIGGSRTIGATAFIPPGGSMKGDILLDHFDLGYFTPLLESVFSDMGGTVSGSIGFEGTTDRLALTSKALHVDDALLTLAFTNVQYKINGPLEVSPSGVRFASLDARDSRNGKGTIDGILKWDYLKDMSLDMGVRVENMQVLDSKEGMNPQFYGSARGSGTVDIKGPFNALNLNIDVTTSGRGDFHLPLTSYSSNRRSNLLTFKEPDEHIEIDPYDEMLSSLKKESRKQNNMVVKLGVNVKDDVDAYIEIDKSSGNILKGNGNGRIELDVMPAQSIFNLGGRYNITQGNYHLDVLGLAKRDFQIENGSTVQFNGDVMDTDLDINAYYQTKASVGTLIADTTSTSRRNVRCGIAITGKLHNPEIAFSVDVPDLDPITSARVQAALSTEDQVQKQFLSLVISGGFLPDEQNGIMNNNSMLNTTVSEIMASQLSAILQKLNIPVDLGIDYQNGNNGNDVFDVALSTELFNNRVIVNGTIGNKYGSTSGNNEVKGDLDIEIKIDKSGAVRLNLFSHSADEYTNFLDNSQRNGVGITYQREFNSFKTFIRDIFTKRSVRQAREQARDFEQITEERKVIVITEDN